MEADYNTETNVREQNPPKPFHCSHHAAGRMYLRFPEFLESWQIQKLLSSEVGPVAGVVERFASVATPCEEINSCSEFMKRKAEKFGQAAEYIGFGNMIFVTIPQSEEWRGTRLIVTVMKREVIMNAIRGFLFPPSKFRKLREKTPVNVKPSLIKRKKWK